MEPLILKLIIASLVFSTVFCGLMFIGHVRAERHERAERIRRRLEFVTTCNKLGIDPEPFELTRSAFEHGEFVGDPSLAPLPDIVGLQRKQEAYHAMMKQPFEVRLERDRQAMLSATRRKECDRAFAMGKRTAIGLVKGKPFKPCPYAQLHMIEAWERGYKAWSRIVSLKTEGEK